MHFIEYFNRLQANCFRGEQFVLYVNKAMLLWLGTYICFHLSSCPIYLYFYVSSQGSDFVSTEADFSTRYSLPVTFYSLLVAFYSLLVTRYVLLVTRYFLLVTRCFFTRYSLPFTRYSLLFYFCTCLIKSALFFEYPSWNESWSCV